MEGAQGDRTMIETLLTYLIIYVIITTPIVYYLKKAIKKDQEQMALAFRLLSTPPDQINQVMYEIHKEQQNHD